MGRKIKKFEDGSFLEYDWGKFDEWCVYHTDSDGNRKPPLDMDYFKQIKDFSDKYGVDRVYGDYVRVYDITKKEVDNNDLYIISDIAKEYGEDSIEMDTVLSILYMAMISEERKKFTKLGKRIKRLGVYMILIEDKPIKFAANFMKGMKWREIDELCKERGF